MRKIILYLVMLLLLGFFCNACVPHDGDAAQTPALTIELPTPTVSPSPTPTTQGSAWERAPLAESFLLEMKEGHTATIALHPAGEESYTLSIDFDGETYTDSFTWLYDVSLYMGDIQFGDGSRELFLIGDIASTDYITYIYRLSAEGQITRTEVEGIVRDVNGNGELGVETVVNVLGTYLANCTYQLLTDGSLVLSSPYSIPQPDVYAEDRRLTLLQELHGALQEEDGEFVPVTLTASMRLLLFETDAESYVLLTGENGEVVRLEISFAEGEWTSRVNGIPEEECFEGFLYAG